MKEYRAAGGIVVDETTGHVLLLHRRDRPGPGGRAEMRLPKGHVEPGERDLDTALREVAEEAGLPHVYVLADLGAQLVEFDWHDTHYRRDEHYFLLRLPPAAPRLASEPQFERVWLDWPAALEALSFEAEKEWLRRAHAAWQTPN
ncbi:MAG TPA: NUDIX domain-containing protein [Anaerolineae bacterium]|nr:NUDIX domain-containing protein [Anaerolineae bacterium]